MLKYILIFIYFKFSILQPVCIETINYCSLCNNITKLCEKCEKDIFIPDLNGGCKPAKKCILGNGHCMECDQDTNLCKSCEDRYYPDEIGGCSYTKECEISFEGECLKCKEGSILVGSDIKICKSLNSEDLKNCEKINTINGLCDSCEEGFYLNSGDKKCIKTENCLKSSFGVCKICSANYYLDKINEEGICIDINYCLKEAPYVKCEKCISGYYRTVYGDSCTKEKNCYLGNKDLGLCYQCESEYYIDFKDGKCKSNREENDFKYCRKADGTCYDCIYTTYLGKDNKCSLSKYCEESDKGKCIQCIDNYHLGLDNICTNVEKCIYTDFYDVCTECEDNYYYNRTSRACELEKENFENCKITTFDGQFCDRCKNDFYLNKTDYLCYSNKEKNDFYKCEYTSYDSTYCSVCEEGYYVGYIDHKCTTMEGCDISENENKCIKCDSDYYCFNAKTERCEPNDEIISEEKKYFYRCNKTNSEGTSCEICIDGYELKNGICVDYLHCVEKDENGKCIKCFTYEEDYYYHCLNDVFECVDTYKDGCAICNNDLFDFDNCTKCMDNFEMNHVNECFEIIDN